jgi:glutamine synthetase
MKNLGVDVLPEHLGEAILLFEKDDLMKKALGEYLYRNLIELKRTEYGEYLEYTKVEWAASRPKITEWEYENYLTRC